MEAEITNGTIEIDTDEIRYEIEDDILSQVNDYVDTDNIRYEIEDDILSQVHDHLDTDTLFEYVDDHVDFYHNTHQLDFDEIRENIEGDMMCSIHDYLDYDMIIPKLNRRQIPELMVKIAGMENEINSLIFVLEQQQEMMKKVMSQIEELQMSVWSRIVRYVRSWF